MTYRPRLFVLVLSAAVCADPTPAADPPPKVRTGARATPHPDAPRPERDGKNALTSKVGSLSPAGGGLRGQVARKNYIDEEIFGKMERDGVPHARLASDQEFLRRVYLDLTGRSPEPAAVRRFLADHDPAKRDKLIDTLVSPHRFAFKDSDPFVDRWTYWFCDLFGNNSAELGTPGRNIFYDYIYATLRLNVPYNQFVEEMLTATARSNWFSGPANFLTRHHVDDAAGLQTMHEDTCDEVAVATGRVFLGLNLECVSCHNGANHLEKINLWLTRRTRDELWRQAAFFGKIDVYRPPPFRQEFTLLETGKGYDVTAESVVRIKRWDADVSPAYLLTGERPGSNEDPRRAFARMLTSDPQFAKATVNWVWAELMGVGIVDPPYDFDLARQDPKHPPPAPWAVQPTHPELLERLAKDFRAHRFDLRYLIKLITKSSAYQLASHFDGPWKDEYARYFARRFVRRLSAEELFDAVSQATGFFPDIPVAGTDVRVRYVMQTRSPNDLGGRYAEVGRFLGNFGQSNRSRNVRSLRGTIPQAALMMNSKIIKEKVEARPGGRLHQLLHQDGLNNDQLVEELFLAALSRFPTAEEKALAVKQIQDYRTQGAEDVMWALVNKLDFLFNY